MHHTLTWYPVSIGGAKPPHRFHVGALIGRLGWLSIHGGRNAFDRCTPSTAPRMEGNEKGENDACASAWSSLDAAGQIPVRAELSATKKVRFGSLRHCTPTSLNSYSRRISVAALKRGGDGGDRKGWERDSQGRGKEGKGRKGKGREAKKSSGFIRATNVIDAELSSTDN